MNKRTLGRTGLEVSELALGGLFVSHHGGAFEQGRAAIHRALQLGINTIDTAPTYGDSEDVLGRALEGVEQPLIFSTKLGGRPQPFLPQDKACLMQSVKESLRLLKRDSIDMLMVHEPDRPGQYDWWSDEENFTGPVTEVMDELKQQGLIRFTGLGGTTVYEMARIIRTGRFDVVLTAFNYSLLWREAEREVIPAAVEQGMGILVGSPLQQGSLARRYDQQIKHGAPWLSTPRRAQFLALYEFLDDINIPLPELGLRFILSNPAVSCVLTGARSSEEVEQNVAAAGKGPLAPEILHRLDEIAAMVPFRPFEEPSSLPFTWDYRGPGRM
ncbi:MAG TPA: aldo/keto reductase [Abditibacteriaceae bacterium]|jgi:aryl-alcohol dehydrogenase-like predicted oxidoreductase